MTISHLENGQKASAVFIMGLVSLIAIAGLSVADLAMVQAPDGHSSQLIVAAFTFFCSSATSALAYLMGSSQPDQGSPRIPILPGATSRVSVTSERLPESEGDPEKDDTKQE